MMELRYTLLAEGSSDQSLLPILTWLLHEHIPHHSVQAAWADLSRLTLKRSTIHTRIKRSLFFFPCDLLFVHRDADRDPRSSRVDEILRAKEIVAATQDLPPVICVVPVRMTEAWLLFDEAALRRAAGNPHGRQVLPIPRLRDIEDIADPKDLLNSILREATGLGVHRMRNVRISSYARRVSELTDDFSPLRELSAFQALETDIIQFIHERHWSSNQE
jgi:hypothetical protein